MSGFDDEDTNGDGFGIRKSARFAPDQDGSFNGGDAAALPAAQSPDGTWQDTQAETGLSFTGPGEWSDLEYAPPANPTLSDEVTFISGLNPNGTLALYSYASWNEDRPATYDGGFTNASKWYANGSASTAGTPGGTVTYYLDPSWTNAAVVETSLALWQSLAGITFQPAASLATAHIVFVEGNDGGAHATRSYAARTSGQGETDGTKLLQLTKAVISIDTDIQGFGPYASPSTPGSFSDYGGYPWQALLHEIGHALGLNHGGPYPLSPHSTNDLQYSAYDNRLYTIMSYINPRTSGAAYYSQYNPSGTNWGVSNTGGFLYPREAVTPMMVDIQAIQRIYGTPGTTALNNVTFGFNTTISGAVANFFDFTKNTRPVVTLWASGTNNALDVSGFSTDSVVNLTPGTFSSAGTTLTTNGSTVINMVNNIGIAENTRIDRLYTGSGSDIITGNNNDNYIFASIGNNVINGGGGSDTVAYAFNRSTYTITPNGSGGVTVAGNSTNDSLTSIEFLAFADQTVTIGSVSTQPDLLINSFSLSQGQASFAINNSGDAAGASTFGLYLSTDSTITTADTLLGTTAVSAMAGGTSIVSGMGFTLPGNLTPGAYYLGGIADKDNAIAESNEANNTSTSFLTPLIVGNNSNNTLNGTGGNDAIFAMGGDDMLQGGAGNDYLDGGSGIDFADYRTAPSGVKVDPSIAVAQNTLGAGTDTLAGVEIVYGTEFDDALSISGLGTFSLYGFGGNDVLTAGANGSVLDGGSGNDTITGGSGLDTLIGGDGDDSINGSTGMDTVQYTLATTGVTVDLTITTAQATGGGGMDTLTNIENLYGSGNSDTLLGTEGENFIFGNYGDDVIRGRGGNDTLIGSFGSDTIFGGDGEDILFAANNYDSSSDGTNFLYGDDGDDALYGGDGIDTLEGGTGNDTLNGGVNLDLASYAGATAGVTVDLTLSSAQNTAGAGMDTLVGIEGLIGSGFNDTLLGSNSDDVFTGNGGTNIIDGRGGNDTANYAGAFSSYSVRLNTNATISVTGNGVTDTLTSIELLKFSDMTISSASLARIRASDFNGDGKSDFLWQNDSGQTAIWLMNGSTVLDTPAIGDNPGPNWFVKGTGDFNGDGRSDILRQNYNGQIAVWLMNGSSVLSATTLADNPGITWHAQGAGDFNGDGKSDILFQNDNGQAAIWMMSGATIVSTPTISGNPGTTWHIRGTGDFNGDGKSDILWENDNGAAAIWMMNGSAVLDTPTVGSNPGTAWHVKGTGDFNGDGKSDIIRQNDNGQISITLMNGSSVLSTSVLADNPGTTWRVKATGDLDGDGKSDILFQNDNGQAAAWMMNGTSIISTPTISGNPGTSWHVKGTGDIVKARQSDFNGDGQSDLLWQNDNGQAAIWLMNGSTLLTTPTVGDNQGPAWTVKGTGDFNGDGKSDIIRQNNNGQTSIWMMNGGTMLSASVLAENPGPTWHVQGAGDFNGDGKSDILWQNDNGRAAIWLMNGSTVLSTPTIGANPGTTWHVKGAGDFNGDGKSDMLWQNDSGQTAIWLMDGGTILATPTVGDNQGPAWKVKGTGDFNGDGKSDVLRQNDNGQVAIWLMSGSTVLSATVLAANPGPTWHVEGAGDLNGDGRSDILFQNDSGQPAVWMMNGTSILSTPTIGANPGTTWHMVGG